MGKKSKQTTTNEPWKAAQPYLLGGAKQLQGAYNANSGALQNATNQVTALLPGVIEKYKQGNPAVTAAQGYAADVLGGKYLNGNPYLQGIIDRTNNSVVNQTQAALGLKGLTGGSTYADLISKNVAQNEGNLRYQDYGNERAAMGQAAGMAPGLAAADTIQLAPTLSLLGAYNAPIDAASRYASSLGGMFSPYGTQTTTKSGGGLLGGLGNALSAISYFIPKPLP